MMKWLRKQDLPLAICLSLALLLSSCAQQVAPTGGIQDKIAPKVLESSPENPSTNFNGKKIKIVFDEYIKVNDINSQLVISPPLKRVPEVKVKNKTLTLDLEDTLKPNTTYTFSFGNSIVDYTEANPLENYQFVFSTGFALDSLSLKGTVDKAFNHSVEKGVLVMLYAEEKTKADSFPYHEMPDYFAKTNEFGAFVINHIREGKYKLIALKEANANYLFDSDDEWIAFSDSLLILTKNSEAELHLFQEQKSKLFLKKPVKLGDGLLTLSFSKPTENIQLESLLPDQKMEWTYLENSTIKDTVRYWFANPSGDSLKLKVLENGKALDTIAVKILKKDDHSYRGDKAIEVLIKTNLNPERTLDLKKKILLQFPQPIKKFTASRISLTRRNVPIDFSLHFIDSLKRRAELDAVFEEDSTYKLLIPQGVFEQYDRLKNDTNIINFRVLSSRDYGSLKLKVKLKQSGSYLLQMLDEKEAVLNERKLNNSEVILYELLKPGNYKFKLIADENNNGKWDTGKFLLHQQAEKTYYFPTALTVRSNWDMDETWDVLK